MLYFYRIMCHLTRFELVLALSAGSNPSYITALHVDLTRWERALHREILARQTVGRYVRAVRTD